MTAPSYIIFVVFKRMHVMKHSGTLFLLVTIFTLFVTHIVSADGGTPNPPSDVIASWSATGAANISWNSSGGSDVSFSIYYATGFASSVASATWHKVATTAASSASIDKLTLGLATPQTMSFYVTSLSTNSDHGTTTTLESNPSAIAVAVVRGATTGSSTDTIAFLTSPIRTAVVGQRYEYIAQTLSVGPHAGTIMYALTTGPSSMSLDSAKGRIRWTPTAAETASVSLKALRDTFATATQSWSIVVSDSTSSSGGHHDSSNSSTPRIESTVVDSTTGVAIGNALVTWSSLSGPLLYSATTDDQGRYRVELPSGTYRAHASAAGYTSLYWPAAADAASATVVTIGTRDTTGFAFRLPSTTATALGTIAVHVTDSSSGLPISGATISVVVRTHSESHGGNGGSGGHGGDDHGVDNGKTQVFVQTDSLGNAVMHFNSGVFFIQAGAAGHGARWYNGSTDLTGATPILVNSGDSINIPISLLSDSTTATTATITGVVRGIQGTDTIVFAGATVQVFGQSDRSDKGEDHGGSGQHGNDHHASGITAVTDVNGAFSFTLAAGHTYILSATDSGFNSLFFNQQSNPLDANAIVLNGDTAGLDFVLGAFVAPNNSVTGHVLSCDTSNTVVRGFVIAYKSTGEHFASAVTVSTDSTGAFQFTGLAAGRYVFEAVPSDSGFLAGYYDSSASCAHEWENGTVLAIADTTALTSIDIRTPRVTADTDGFINVHGEIEVLVSNGTPTHLGGAMVFAHDSAGSVVASTVTHTDGSFTLMGLKPAVYTIGMDRPSYQQTSAVRVTADYDTNIAPHVTLFAHAVAEGASDVHAPSATPDVIFLAQNFPDPFSATTTIAYRVVEPDAVTLDVFSVIGTNVARLVAGTRDAGEYHAQFSGSNLRSGIYFVRLTSAGRTMTRQMSLMH